MHLTNRIFTALILVAFFLCISTPASNAQNKEGSTVVSLNLGYGLSASVVKVGLNSFSNVNISSNLVRSVTVDYAISDYLSIGLAGGRQLINAEFDNSYISDKTNGTIDEVAKIDIKRTQFAIRPLVHYGGNERLDIYSGLRLGLTHLKLKYITDDPDLQDKIKFGGIRPSFGVVLVGMRYFVTDWLGANFDVQIGAPYLVSGGVSFKF